MQILARKLSPKFSNQKIIQDPNAQFFQQLIKESSIIMTQNSDSHRNDTSKMLGLIGDRSRKTNKLKIKEKKIQDDQESFGAKRPSKRRKTKKFNKHWRKEDNIIYLKFLLYHSHLFCSQVLRRCNKVFLRISKAMKNKKTPNQCKSHHQKMLNYTISRTTEEIIRYLLLKFNDNNLREQIKEQYLQIQKGHQNVEISQDLKQFLNKQLNEVKIEQKDEQIVSKDKKRRTQKYQGQRKETLPILHSQNEYAIKVNNVRNSFNIIISLFCGEFEIW